MMGHLQVVVMILVLGPLCTDHLNVAADVIIEARESQICSYEVNDNMRLEMDPNCFIQGLQFAVAIATDVRQQVLFFTDVFEGKIFRTSIAPGSQPVRTVLYGLGSVEGIAVDWLALNLFWTDFNLNHICVSRYDGTDRKILIDDDVLNPRGLVVHPLEGWIFWTDLRSVHDSEGRIERANMNGRERVAIVENNLISPNGLVIDFTTNRLFFVDRGTDKIESVTFYGTNRRTIYEQNGADFFDITIYGDHLYTTIWRSTEADGKVTVLLVTNQDTWEVIQTLDHDDRALGITTLDESVQPDELQGDMGTCGDVNGECEHLCLQVGSTNRTCACATGYSLDVDGQSCKTGHTTNYFLLVADSSLNGVYQIDGVSDFQVSAVPLDDLVFPVSVGYDHVSGMMYWSDRSRSTIGRASLDGSYQETGLFGNIIDPGGIALDTRRRLIYWTDEARDSISRAGIDDNIESTVIIDEDLDQPRAIAVNILNGDVYWTDWGMDSKIERVSVEGTNREVLVDDRLGWPNCLAIDSEGELMYWCDAQFDRLEMSDLDGNNRRVLVLFDQEAHPFSMAIYGEYIYWTDWTKNRLTRANRWTGAGVEEVGNETFLRLQGLVAYEFIDVVEEFTSPQESSSSASTGETTPTALPTALNVALIAAAGGGGLALILLIVIICCAVRCARKSGGSQHPKEDHVPMSVRSTSFVGSYDPSGVPKPDKLNNNPSAAKQLPSDHPPPLPPSRTTEDPIYQDIEEYTKPGGEAAYQAYINPAFKDNGDGSPAGKGDSSPRYVNALVKQQSNVKPKAKPKPKPKPKPSRQVQTATSLSSNNTYLSPQLPAEQDYMDLRINTP